LSPEKKLLLHVCCAPDATHPITVLRQEFAIAPFFYNPNIHPASEYRRRLDELVKLAKAWGFTFIEGEYGGAESGAPASHGEPAPWMSDIDFCRTAWFAQTQGLEREPEGGARCIQCFRMRLGRAARLAADLDIPTFATVMTISPHKNADAINDVGREAAGKLGVKYMPSNFKKRDGFKKSLAFSRELGLYRQNFCGCIYSAVRQVESTSASS
jgi:hypothetical protein